MGAVTSPWDQSAASFRGALSEAVPTETLRTLHRLAPWRHAAVALRQLAVLAAAAWAVVAHGDLVWVWVPATVAIGFVLFDFTVLLHEVVHEVVVPERRSRWHRVLGHAYALPSGLSCAQFRRWHLDHHANLGTTDADPKRAYLTPRVITRLFKALYLTPALFPIYFRAAARAGASYEPALRRRIAWERRAAVAFHLALAALITWSLGPWRLLQLHLLPLLVVFPVAFTLNRLGQHYDVDPDDPAQWGTLMRPSPWLWDRIFLWSNYHLEHHYFPRVPMYHLPALRRALTGFFEGRGMRPRRYGGLLFDWFVRNRVPHTRWSAAPPAGGPARDPA
jgi:fatty acid desaturase